MNVKAMWTTPDGDNLVGYMARVSNPKAQPDDPADRLIRYLLRNAHWSPFEMVNACVEINTTRDISRQILRHRSFSFQEFSGRYAAYEEVGTDLREARLQDKTNRQSSLPAPAEEVDWFNQAQKEVADFAFEKYQEALARGHAKENARAVLPEGLTPTKLFMNGTLRSWIHYWQVRCTAGTQKEHRLVAEETRKIILTDFPNIRNALDNWEPPQDG